MITDTTDTAYAELYSPDAKLLIPFTAAGLKEAEEKNEPVTLQLQVALDDKHVVCYIKYFVRMVRGAVARKYPLSKIYAYEDVFGTDESSSKEPVFEAPPLSALHTEHTVDLSKDDEDEVQFFTPSTKAVIHQISQETQTSSGDANTTPGCKRVLSFSEMLKATAKVKIEPVDDDPIMQHSVGASESSESPVKKPKAKPRQN